MNNDKFKQSLKKLDNNRLVECFYASTMIGEWCKGGLLPVCDQPAIEQLEQAVTMGEILKSKLVAMLSCGGAETDFHALGVEATNAAIEEGKLRAQRYFCTVTTPEEHDKVLMSEVLVERLKELFSSTNPKLLTQPA